MVLTTALRNRKQRSVLSGVRWLDISKQLLRPASDRDIEMIRSRDSGHSKVQRDKRTSAQMSFPVFPRPSSTLPHLL